METDLSLIEISDEDDSLLSLQQSPNDTVLISNEKPYFSCSPLLQMPRSTRSVGPRPPLLESPIEITKSEEDTGKPISSSCANSKNNSANKENVNGNKDEVPKLSVEPQQMKRKKKGGAYNLRKSLAWNRAFFTEEGVLDPLELSMLSGETLSVIHEGRESLSSEVDSGNASAALKALESNLFKEVPSSAPIEGRKVVGKMSPKLASPARDKLNPASAVKRKVLSAHDINRGASKRSGCPRPVASFSTSNTNAMKVTVKDSRVSKPLATNNAPPVTSMTSRSSSSSASHLRRNFTSQSVAARKETEIKGTLTSIKNGSNDAKCGPPGKMIKKPTCLLPRRNVVKVRAEHEIHSLSSVQLPQLSQANNSLEGSPDSTVSAAAHPLNDNDSNTGKNTISSSQTASCYSANMQQTQPQIAKPSGLRMPSPSLGFFGQSKSSDSHNMLKRGTQPCNLLQSNIPNVKASVLNPIHQRPPRPSSNIPPCLSATHSVASAVNAASDGKIKSDLGLRNMQKVALQLQFNSESSDIVNHKQQVHDTGLKSLDDAEKSKRENSCIGNVGMRINDGKLPVESATCEQVEKDDGGRAVDSFLKSKDSTNAGIDKEYLSVEVEGPSETKNTFAKQQLEEGHYKSSLQAHNISLESLTAAVNTDWDKTGSQVHKDQVSSMDEFKPTAQQAELKKPGTCKLHLMSDVESQNDTFCKDSKSSKKVVKDNIVNAAYDVLEEIDCGAASDNPSHCTDAEPKRDKTNETDCLNKEMQAGDLQILSLDGTLMVESCKTFSNTSAADDWMIIENPSAKSGEETQILNSCLVTEQVFRDNCEPPSDGCLLSGKCAKESQEKDFHQSVNSAESRTNDFGGKWGSSTAPCLVPPVNQDYGFAAIPDNASKAYVDNESVVESKHDVKLYGEAHALALDNMGKSSSIISHNVAEKIFCSNGGDFSGSKLENPNDIFQSSPVKQVEVASGMNNMIVHEGVTDKQFDSSKKNLIFSDLQTQNAAHYCEKDTAMFHVDCNDAMHDVREHAAEQAKLVKSCSHEVEQVNQQDNVRDVPCCDGNRSFENVSTIGRSGFKISQSPQQFATTENEPAAVDNTIKETLIDDGSVQSTNESSLADCYNGKTIMSLTNKGSLLLPVDRIKQPKEDPELQNLDSVMELVQKENQGLSLDDNLFLGNTSVESHGKDIVETVSSATLEQHNGFPNESKSFDACLCSPHMLQDINVDRSEEYQSLEPSFENVECYMGCDYRNDYELNNQSCALNVASSSNSEENQIQVAEKTSASKSSCSLNEKTIDMSNESIQKDVEEDILKNNISPSEGEFNIHQSNGSTASELQNGLFFIVHPQVVKEVTFSHNMSVNDNKQDSPAIRPPPNAVPFSNEWLAAFEAAGEEILAKKGGAVQNSPPDKSLPEPGPWSPVKRKNNQEIGPFDCTKFTNPNIPPSTSN